MPDFNHPHAKDDAPLSWSDAFAALPQETPPGDGWSRIAGALEARASRHGAARRERRTSWLLGLASAAVLVVAAWSPLSGWWQGDGSRQEPTLAAADAPGVRGPAAPAYVEAQKPPSIDQKSGVGAVAVEEPAARIAESAKPAQGNQRNARVAAQRSPAASVVERRPRENTQSPTVQTAIAAATTETAPTTPDPLEQLKLQSAQLEALVAMARDERVGNASNELLSSELDAGIAAVDAALSQADVADSRKQELWQQRVDLLQQLAGVEATSRWLAAQGTSNDTLFVSVD